jgi:abhydrolase domain-containing protein 14
MSLCRALLLVCLAVAIGGPALAHEPEAPPAAAGAAAPEPDAGSIQERKLRVAGIEVHLLVGGMPGHPTVLLLHGARYDAETWRKLGTLERLIGAGYRVLALDLPGFGSSPASDTPRAELLARLLPLVAGEPVVVVAPSLAGLYVLPLVAERPDLVMGWVGIAPAGIAEHAAALSGSSVPALLLWGAKDEVVPVAEARKLTAAVPSAKLVVLQGAGHACYLERPEDFHRELLAFLAKVLPAE